MVSRRKATLETTEVSDASTRDYLASFKKFVKWIGETGLVNQLLTHARPHADAKKHSLSNVAHRGKARAFLR